MNIKWNYFDTQNKPLAATNLWHVSHVSTVSNWSSEDMTTLLKQPRPQTHTLYLTSAVLWIFETGKLYEFCARFCESSQSPIKYEIYNIILQDRCGIILDIIWNIKLREKII